MSNATEISSYPQFDRFQNMVASTYNAEPAGRLTDAHAKAALALAKAMREDFRIGPNTEALAWVIAGACTNEERPLALHVLRSLPTLSVTLRAEMAAIDEEIKKGSTDGNDDGPGAA